MKTKVKKKIHDNFMLGLWNQNIYIINSVSTSVCLCLIHHSSKTTRQIYFKFGGEMHLIPMSLSIYIS